MKKQAMVGLLAMVMMGCTVQTTGDNGAAGGAGSSGGAAVNGGGAGASAGAGAGAGATGSACATPRFFNEVNYQAESVELAAGRYDVAQLDQTPVQNDTIMSVCVPPGWRVTLFMDGGFAGEQVELTSSVADLGAHNRSTSSVVVTAP